MAQTGRPRKQENGLVEWDKQGLFRSVKMDQLTRKLVSF